ncbi:unnamed protein product [Chrysoparadoxa australica]
MGKGAVSNAAVAPDDDKPPGGTVGEKEKTEMVSPLKLFRFADALDVFLMATGTVTAIGSGLLMPMWLLSFGGAVDDFNGTDIRGPINEFALQFAIFGVITLCLSTIMIACWAYTGERQSLRIKTAYVKSILRQDIGWFDTHKAGELPTKVAGSLAKINDGMGRKIADILFNLTAFTGSFVVAFFYNWLLSLVMLASLPVLGALTGLMTKAMTSSNKEGQGHYAAAGAIANEVLSGIRTVASLCSEPDEKIRYNSSLSAAKAAGIKSGMEKGIGMGVTFFAFYSVYGVSFWFGAKQVADDIEAQCTEDCTSGGDVIIAIYGMLIAASTLGQMAPGITAFALALSTAVPVFETIDRVPDIDSNSTEGKMLEGDVKGKLELRGVGFSYPARPDDTVFSGINLCIEPGESVALVGASGGGKSTLAKLLLRFYDPTTGSVCLDGEDIKTLNVGSFRRHIGYVGQEPVLFSGSIADNIAKGSIGKGEEKCSKEVIVAAAKAANAHKFITEFPKGYDTDCGEGGLQLSGGQKQRIAIARAIIRDPAILLLDEATSALDSESEKVVQQALDNLRGIKRRTTITVAHRLSTIQNCDRIAVIGGGGVKEIGSHSELMERRGAYTELVQARMGGEDAGVDGTGEETKAEGITRQRSASGINRKGSQDSGLGDWQGQENTKDEEVVKEEEVKKLESDEMKRLWALNRSELPYLALGCFGALFAGATFPMEGVLVASIQSRFYTTDADQLRDDAVLWCSMFFVLAVVAMIGNAAVAYGFVFAGESLTTRLRDMCFTGYLSHHIAWFNEPSNAVGVLTTRLEEDAGKVHNVTGTALGVKVQLGMTLLVAITIGLASSWKIGLISISIIPLMAVAGFVQMQMFTGNNNEGEGQDGGSEAGMILGGSLNNMSTVTAFSMQNDTSTSYEKAIAKTIIRRKKIAIVSGLGFGYSQGMMFWAFGLLFYVGAILVDEGEVTFEGFFRSMFAIISGSFGLGAINVDMDGAAVGRKAARRIFQTADETEGQALNPFDQSGAKPTSCAGKVSFKSVKFAYPSRPDQAVYTDLNLEVTAGDTVALVGMSGCGKSTCLSLLLRLYEADAGDILLDDRSIKELNLHWLRSQCGYVGQEPVLFSGTIRDQIAKGKTNATDDEVIAAAKAANAHDFISEFPDRYDTDIGEKSALLSGGQKQRIAIARAIIGDPPLLLLDEATSALDNESERVVQAALDSLSQARKRTTLVVAHRLSTVQNADQIVVMGGGGVKEKGTHAELTALPGGVYRSLWERQNAMFKA